MANFKPTSIAKPIADGKVNFKVLDWEETENSKGNEMITVTLLMEDSKKVTKQMKDHFNLTDKAVWKLGVFSNSIGIFDKYEAGSIIDTDAVGCTGECVLKREKNTMKDAKTEKIVVIDEYLEKK